MGKSREGRCREGPESLRDLRVAEVTERDIQLMDGKVELHRVKVKVSFKYEDAK
jgi:dodecin